MSNGEADLHSADDADSTARDGQFIVCLFLHSYLCTFIVFSLFIVSQWSDA